MDIGFWFPKKAHGYDVFKLTTCMLTKLSEDILYLHFLKYQIYKLHRMTKALVCQRTTDF